MDDDKRSRAKGMKPKDTPAQPPEQGVGGRHTDPHLAEGGGGYLDICKKIGAPGLPSKVSGDPRFFELTEMGLSPIWIKVAAALGVNQFLVLWRVLDEVNLGEKTRDMVRLRVPLFSRYLKYQRNKIIWAHADIGSSAAEIQKIIKDTLCEDLHPRHIANIINNRKKLLDEEDSDNPR